MSGEKTIPPNLARFIIKKQGGREYLVVAGRLVWFRQDYPDAGIVTEILSEEWSEEAGNAVKIRASIFLPDGRLLATGTAKQAELGPNGFADYIEKCETAAVGRALLMGGYGTANAQELEVEGKLADGPLEERPRPAPTMTGRSDANSSDPTRRPSPEARTATKGSPTLVGPPKGSRRPAPPPGWTEEDEAAYQAEGAALVAPPASRPPRPAPPGGDGLRGSSGRVFSDEEAPRGRRS